MLRSFAKSSLHLYLHQNQNPKTLHLHLTTVNAFHPQNLAVASTKDDYFSAIHHITNIVRRNHFMERTLNKLRIAVDSDLVFRVLRACSASATESLRFFNWARTHHPTYHPETEELVKTLARSKKYDSMWKILNSMKTHHSLTLSQDTLCFIIQEYGKHGLIDQAVELFNRAPKTFNCLQSVEVHNALLFSLCQTKLFHGAYALVHRLI